MKRILISYFLVFSLLSNCKLSDGALNQLNNLEAYVESKIKEIEEYDLSKEDNQELDKNALREEVRGEINRIIASIDPVAEELNNAELEPGDEPENELDVHRYYLLNILDLALE